MKLRYMGTDKGFNKKAGAVFKHLQGQVASKGLAAETGLHLNTVYNCRAGSHKVLLAVYAKLLDSLGYEIHIVKKEG